MSHRLVIEITVPLSTDSVIDHSEMLAKARVPLDNLIEHLPNATHSARIVKARAAETEPRKPRLAAAE